MVFSKRRVVPATADSPAIDDVVIVVANLDPHSTRESQIRLTMPELGLDYHDRFVARDEITGTEWSWGEHNYVRLGPENEPVHIVSVRR